MNLLSQFNQNSTSCHHICSGSSSVTIFQVMADALGLSSVRILLSQFCQNGTSPWCFLKWFFHPLTSTLILGSKSLLVFRCAGNGAQFILEFLPLIQWSLNKTCFHLFKFYLALVGRNTWMPWKKGPHERFICSLKNNSLGDTCSEKQCISVVVSQGE